MATEVRKTVPDFSSCQHVGPRTNRSSWRLQSYVLSSSRCSQHKSGDVARCPASIGICGKTTGSNGARICTLWVSYRQTQTQTQTRRNTLSLRAPTFSARLALSNRSPSASSCARALDKNNVYELKSVVPSDRGIPSRPLTYHCSIIVYISPSILFCVLNALPVHRPASPAIISRPVLYSLCYCLVLCIYRTALT
ncbi:hypothetical protein DFH06DRAFT_602319 [Mycena polygramma]|nr:hypothetical protein DFH06DRAFT_602319 [Mycena polygramma]